MTNKSIIYEKFKCPKCDTMAKKHSIGIRKIKEANKLQPEIITVKYSKHYCPKCDKIFSIPLNFLARKYCSYSRNVERLAIDYVFKKNMTLENASISLKNHWNVNVPPTTMHDWIINETYEK